MDAKFVCFDIGNVLMSAHTRWREAVESAGVACGRPEGLDTVTFELPEYLQYESGRVAEAEYLKAIKTHLGLLTTEDARKVHEYILGDEFPGVYDIVHQLRLNGVPTACLSNNNPIHWHVFTQTDRFPAVREIEQPFASYILGAHKPEPEVFALFEKATGWPAAQILFIEDNRTNAEAAKAAGWQSVVVDPKQPMAPQLRTILASLL